MSLALGIKFNPIPSLQPRPFRLYLYYINNYGLWRWYALNVSCSMLQDIRWQGFKNIITFSKDQSSMVSSFSKSEYLLCWDIYFIVSVCHRLATSVCSGSALECRSWAYFWVSSCLKIMSGRNNELLKIVTGKRLKSVLIILTNVKGYNLGASCGHHFSYQNGDHR